MTPAISSEAYHKILRLVFTFYESVFSIITSMKDLFISSTLYSILFMHINRNKPVHIPKVISPEGTGGSHCFSTNHFPKNSSTSVNKLQPLRQVVEYICTIWKYGLTEQARTLHLFAPGSDPHKPWCVLAYLDSVEAHLSPLRILLAWSLSFSKMIIKGLRKGTDVLASLRFKTKMV